MKRLLAIAALLMGFCLWLSPSVLSQFRNPPPVRSDARGRQVDWKLLFNQLFALEIRKEHQSKFSDAAQTLQFDRLLQGYTHYNPGTFNDALDTLSKARTSNEAYEARHKFFEDPENRKLIATWDLRRSVGDRVLSAPRVQEFFATIEANALRDVDPDENFFESPEGQNILRAFQRDAAGQPQEVAFVFVPGYAAHTIKWYIFEEIVKDANRYYGRAAERPVLHEDAIDLTFEDHVTFYERSNGRTNPFDILHPTGAEFGNTAGFNAETADRIYEWVKRLPPAYANKKLIFLGYSKGAPVVLEMLERHPDLADRVLGHVTFAGVIQGTGVARSALQEAESILKDESIQEFVARAKAERPESLGQILSPLFGHVDLALLSWPRLRAVFEALDYDIGNMQQQVDRLLEGREVSELLDGMIDMSPMERTRWNLTRLNNKTFPRSTFMFNLSAVTNIKSLVRPLPLGDDGLAPRSLLAPTFLENGDIDFEHFSLDALFLYGSSIEGFKAAPGGLFDTQVELANTKTPLIDRRPLSDSLTREEIDALWADPNVRAAVKESGVTDSERFASLPRSELVSYEQRSHIDAIDLGEFSGHHWSLFVQALRPPADLSQSHATWNFPRKAYMRALLQVLALYNLLQTAS